MKKLLLITLIAICGSAFAQTDVKLEYPLVYQGIKEAAAEEWKADYVMQKHTIDSQCKAFSEFIALSKNYTIPKNDYDKIRIDALFEWRKNKSQSCWSLATLDAIYACPKLDFTMVLYQIKNQIEAYNEMNK